MQIQSVTLHVGLHFFHFNLICKMTIFRKENRRALGSCYAHLRMTVYNGQEGPRALDRSPESWHMFWPVAKEISFKAISMFHSGGHVVKLIKTFWSNLLECIMWNISVKQY